MTFYAIQNNTLLHLYVKRKDEERSLLMIDLGASLEKMNSEVQCLTSNNFL
jgi:hypothetical protein